MEEKRWSQQSLLGTWFIHEFIQKVLRVLKEITEMEALDDSRHRADLAALLILQNARSEPPFPHEWSGINLGLRVTGSINWDSGRKPRAQCALWQHAQPSQPCWNHTLIMGGLYFSHLNSFPTGTVPQDTQLSAGQVAPDVSCCKDSNSLLIPHLWHSPEPLPSLPARSSSPSSHFFHHFLPLDLRHLAWSTPCPALKPLTSQVCP